MLKENEFYEIIYCSGMRKKMKFKIETKKYGKKTYKIIISKKIPIKEMKKVCEKKQLPITDGETLIFPEGKGIKDFLISDS